MVRQIFKKKRWVSLVIGGLLVVNTAAVWAAPVELSLDDSIALALKNNPTVKMADADREKASWAINQAKASGLPTLSYGYTAARTKTTSVINPYNQYSNALTLSIPLYTGGKVEGQIDEAKLNLKVADLSVDQSKQQLKLDATTGYFDILAASNTVDVDKESVNNLAAHLKNVQAQYTVGTVAKSDVLSSEVNLANAQQTLIKAQNAYELAISSLNNVIGLPLSTELKIKDQLKYEKYTVLLEDSIQLALKQRPEAVQVDTNIEIAKKAVKVAQSGKLPTVTFTGSAGWYGYDNKVFGGDTNSWAAQLAANWNVFDSGSTDAQIKQAQASVDKAVEQARQTKDSIQLAVRQAHLNIKEAEKRIETSSVTVNQAEENFKIAQVRYSAGVGTNLDVMDAQVSLTTAKTNYIQAMYDYNTSKAKMDKAVGMPVK